MKKRKKIEDMSDTDKNIYTCIIKINNYNKKIFKNIFMLKLKIHLEILKYFDNDNNFIKKQLYNQLILKFNEYNNNYNKLSKYNKQVYDYICNSANYKNKIIYNTPTELHQYFNIDKHFIKNFNLKIKMNTIFIKKVDSYLSIHNTESIICYQDFINLIKDAKCIPFWNKHIENVASTLFLPINNNLQKIDNKTFNYTNWFDCEFYDNKSNIKSINVDRIKDRKYINDEDNIKCKRIKIYFTEIQRLAINQLFGVYRYFYNRTIQFINNYNKKTKNTFYLINYNNISTKININLNDVQNKFSSITMRNYVKDNKPIWMDFNYPSHLVDKAISEAADNYTKAMDKYNKYHRAFKLKFKTKKDKFQTMNIEKTMISKNRKSIFPQLKFNEMCIFKNINFVEKFNYYNICDSSISCNIRLGEYYLNLNYIDTSKKDLSVLKNKKVCSIDPGCKSFVTIYSDNNVAKIGVNITDKLNKLCKEIDILSSRIYKKKSNTRLFKYNHNKRKNMRKALHRKIKYIDNLKDELHKKTIKYLTDNYSKIILPRFETQKMSMKFNSKIARNLNTISFYKFREKLNNKCIEKDILLEIREEYYTSKTCTCCGYIKNDLGSNRTFECNRCNLIIDRDISAARNIMLRNTNWELPPLVYL